MIEWIAELGVFLLALALGAAVIESRIRSSEARDARRRNRSHRSYRMHAGGRVRGQPARDAIAALERRRNGR